jgi:hypothetical protein
MKTNPNYTKLHYILAGLLGLVFSLTFIFIAFLIPLDRHHYEQKNADIQPSEERKLYLKEISHELNNEFKN